MSNEQMDFIKELFPEFLSLSEVVSTMNVTEQDVERWVRERKLGYFQSSGERWFDPRHVERVLKNAERRRGS